MNKRNHADTTREPKHELNGITPATKRNAVATENRGDIGDYCIGNGLRALQKIVAKNADITADELRQTLEFALAVRDSPQQQVRNRIRAAAIVTQIAARVADAADKVEHYERLDAGRDTEIVTFRAELPRARE